MGLFKNINWEGIAGTSGDILAGSEGSGQVAGDLTEAGLTAALGAVPFVGGILNVIAGKLNISENVGLVTKYGLSSWGASNSPEKSKAEFAEMVYPYYTEELKNLSPETMGVSLTNLYVTLFMNREIRKKMRKYHSRAKSTQLANDWAVEEYTSLISGLEKIVAGIKAKGVPVETTNVSSSASDLAIGDLTYPARTIMDGDVIKSPLTLKRFVINGDDVRALEVDEETGEVKTKSGGFGSLLTYGGLAFAALKAFK